MFMNLRISFDGRKNGIIQSASWTYNNIFILINLTVINENIASNLLRIVFCYLYDVFNGIIAFNDTIYLMFHSDLA